MVAKRTGWKLCVVNGDQHGHIFCAAVLFEEIIKKSKYQIETILHFDFYILTYMVVLFLFIFLAKSSWGIYEMGEASKDRLKQSQDSLKALEARKDDLEKKVSYLSTDEGVESEIRTKFRLAEQGESVAVIVGSTEVANTLTATFAASTTEVSIWQRFLSFIGL